MSKCRHGLSEDCPACMRESINELLRERNELVIALQATQGRIMNAKIDLQTGHTKKSGIQKLDKIIKFVDDALGAKP